MNLGDVQTADGVAAVLQSDDDDAVDPHLERIKNEAGGDESDEEVTFAHISVLISLGIILPFLRLIFHTSLFIHARLFLIR